MGEERGKREEEREGAREERRNDGESRWENQEARREERGERSKDSRDQVKRDQRAERREILDETRKSRQAPMGSPAWSRSSPRPARPRTRRRQSSSGHRATCTGRCERKTLSMPRGGACLGGLGHFKGAVRLQVGRGWCGTMVSFSVAALKRTTRPCPLRLHVISLVPRTSREPASATAAHPLRLRPVKRPTDAVTCSATADA